jgi:protein-S-isoprenylcysteine O-methyltransferase Ste14
MMLGRLVGSGHRIVLFTLPFVVAATLLGVARPSLVSVGGPPPILAIVSLLILVPGVAIWLWSVVLILTRVPRGELITGGPYAVVKHPLYTSVALLVVPWIGFLCDTWLGAPVGAALYLGSRIHAPDEERELAARFGSAWDAYIARVKIPWL